MPSSVLVDGLQSLLADQGLPGPVGGALQKVLLLDRLSEVYRAALAMPEELTIFERILAALNVQPQISEQDFERIPKTGPVVVVANHPFGLIEGCVLATVLGRARPDVKIMANFLMGVFPAMNHGFIYVDPFGSEEAQRSNQKGLREAIRLLRNGGMLGVFPAGEVAHMDLARREITDPAWSSTVARMVRMTRVAVLPLYFDGANSALFQILGLIHPRLRTAMLPHELFNKQHRSIELRVGSLLPAKKLASFPDDDALIGYLRNRTYVLRHRTRNAPARAKAAMSSVPDAGPSELLEREINALSRDRLLAEAGELQAFYATAPEIPHCLNEIGRLREITFRLTGEGTGKALDLDTFDAYYLQLFVWNRQTREIIGAYRLGATDVIAKRMGKKGLYTSTLFAYNDGFLRRIGTALEMGRSFVRREYQKSYSPLLLLWRAIGAYVARNPRYKTLFGPVSISNDYQPVSRQIMVNFLQEQESLSDLSGMVRARSPFRKRPLKQWQAAAGGMRLWDIEELSALVADIETDQKGVPVLLRQYLKLGGKLLAFNVDRHFSDALDGLILVDLTRTDPKMLDRYLGKTGAATFLSYHRELEIA